MNIMKFGGSSVADSSKIKIVADIACNQNPPAGIVLSAMKGITNLLLEAAEKAEQGNSKYSTCFEEIKNKHLQAAKELLEEKPDLYEKAVKSINEKLCELHEILHGVELVRECSPRTKDFLVSFGERLNCETVSLYFQSLGKQSEYIDARELVKTDDNFGSAVVDFEETTFRIKEKLDKCNFIPVITGFIASNRDNITTTLGRNGSDYTATIFGAALYSEKVEIWTDVDGVLTADPRIVKNAYVIPELNIQEAMELSYFGAEVIHPYTLLPVVEKNIPVVIKNTYNPSAPGTFIKKETSPRKNPITGLASIDSTALINVEGGGMVGMPGVASLIFSALAEASVNVIMITQASSEHSICIICRQSELNAARESLEKHLKAAFKSKKIEKISIIENLEIVAVIGENMRGQTGLSGRLFSALGNENVNILAIAQGSTERNISFVIYSDDTAKALNVVHKEFLEK